MKRLANFSFTCCLCGNLFCQKQISDTSYGSVELFAGGVVAIHSVSISRSSSYVKLDIDHPKSYAPSFVVGSKFTLAKSRNSIVVFTAIRVYSITSTAEKDLQSGLAIYQHRSTCKAQPAVSPRYVLVIIS